MRNLIVLISKHYFFFLFLLLETISIYLVVQNNYYHRSGFINSTNAISGYVYQTYTGINDYLHLKEINEQLAQENILFRRMSSSSFIKTSVEKHTINDTIYRQKYEYTVAKVVNNSTNRRNNYLTIDKGYNQGIKIEMAVISSEGIVGIVKEVSANFSSIMSLLHKDTKISAKIKKDGSFGPLFWEGKDYRYASLVDIPTHIKLLKGDTIVTSAYSLTFPENILVGTVEDFEKKTGEYFYTINVKLSTNFKKINYVYVVNNIMKKEQEQLEKTSQND